MDRRRLLLLPVLVIALQASARRLPRMVHLFILPNGHVRFDDGPELDEAQLRTAIGRLKTEDPPPDIALKLTATTNYETVAKVLTIFKEEHYGAHFGLPGWNSRDLSGATSPSVFYYGVAGLRACMNFDTPVWS